MFATAQKKHLRKALKIPQSSVS